VAADKIHCHKPFDEAYLGVLEYGSHQDGKALVALAADIPAVAAGVAVMPATIWADYITVSPT